VGLEGHAWFVATDGLPSALVPGMSKEIVVIKYQIAWRFEEMNTRQKRFKIVPEMEGAMARWYARQRGSASQIRTYRTQAALLTDGLPYGADVLEVAPGLDT
jgi:hypothetical protein